MTTNYDPELSARLVERIKACLNCGMPGGLGMYGRDLQDLADQLEAAMIIHRRYADDLEVMRATEADLQHNRRRADEAERELEVTRAEVAKLREELGHATAHDGDWLSKTSRAMCETVLGERDALRATVRVLTAERDALRAEVERMRPVTEAALAVRSWHDSDDRTGADLDRALDGLLAALARVAP